MPVISRSMANQSLGNLLSGIDNKTVSICLHTAYSWNIMCQKWEGDCGLWVLNKTIKKIYLENLKKIVGAVCELPAK